VGRLEAYAFPRIGAEPIRTLTSPQVLDVLQRIEAKGRVETAQRVKESLGAIFHYAVATYRATHDPSAALAECTGLSRETLYRTLSDKGNPRLDTLAAILHAFGLRIAVAPLPKRSRRARAHAAA